jgi:hypothetical protein
VDRWREEITQHGTRIVGTDRSDQDDLIDGLGRDQRGQPGATGPLP